MRPPSNVMQTIALAAALLLIPTVAPAATFEVASSLDLHDANPGNGFCYAVVGMFGICTLRAAVEEANALSGHDTIIVPAGTFELEHFGGGQLLIDDDVTIVGAGARLTEIGTLGGHRMLQVDEANVTIGDLAFRGARNTDSHTAAVWCNVGCSLDISRVWFDENISYFGGGALVVRGTATVTDSTFTNNEARQNDPSGGQGGAIEVYRAGQVTVVNSTFYGNFAMRGGGAIKVSGSPTWPSSLTLLSSTLINNSHNGGTSDSIKTSGGSLHLDKNIIWPSNCDYFDLNDVTSDGGNAVGPGNGCVLGLPSDMTGLDWQDFALGSLGDYGGPVPTILPGTLSLVVDPGLGTATCPTFDARGEPRVDRCDVGAVERQLDDPESGPMFVDGFESGDTSAWQ